MSNRNEFSVNDREDPSRGEIVIRTLPLSAGLSLLLSPSLSFPFSASSPFGGFVAAARGHEIDSDKHIQIFQSTSDEHRRRTRAFSGCSDRVLLFLIAFRVVYTSSLLYFPFFLSSALFSSFLGKNNRERYALAEVVLVL